ncbi:hypothetical protein Tco_0508999 [Tanacetum coccineum]
MSPKLQLNERRLADRTQNLVNSDSTAVSVRDLERSTYFDSASSRSSSYPSGILYQQQPGISERWRFKQKILNFRNKDKDSILQAGNPVKEILLKLNLPDHRSILTDSKVNPTTRANDKSIFIPPTLLLTVLLQIYIKIDVEVPGSSRLKDS